MQNLFGSLFFVMMFVIFTFGAKIDWETVSIKSIQNMIRSGTTCQDIIQTFLNRINRLEQTPHLGSFISINPNALFIARQLDLQYKTRGLLKGPLHCVPLLPKDNIDVAGIPTTSGLNALRNSVPPRSAPVVNSLVNRGAVVIGKANMSPMAGASAFSKSETGGLVRSPFDLARTTYGSSGGNGAAGAAAYTIVGLGTDTSGSVVLPSSAGNLIGLRPTMGKLSLQGVLAGNLMQDTVGPMVRWAEDLATVMDYLDPTAAVQFKPKYTNPQILNPNGLRGMRIGIFSMMTFGSFSLEVNGKKATYQLSTEARRLVDKAIRNLQLGGATVSTRQGVSLQSASPVLLKMLMMPPKLAACKPRWFDFYFAAMTGNQPYRNFLQFKDSPLLPQDLRQQYQRAWQIQNQCSASINDFNRGKLEFIRKIINPVFTADTDLLIYPTVPNTPEIIEESQEDSITGVQFSPFSGYPTVTIPIGFSTPDAKSKQGLPLGLTFMARPNREDLLVKAAYAYQKKFGVTKLPWTVGGKVNSTDGNGTNLSNKIVALAKDMSTLAQKLLSTFSGQIV